MILTGSDLNLVVQALALAASQYVEFAANAEDIVNGERLAQEFRAQAIAVRKLAILLGDSEAVTLDVGGDQAEQRAHRVARRITVQQVIDVRESRNILGAVTE